MGSRARSAHSARVIDESGDHKNHSPDPDAAAAAAVAATTAARGEAGSAALVCVEFAAEHTFRERAFPPGAPLPPPPPLPSPPPPPPPPAAIRLPIPVVVRRSLRLVAVVVVASRARSRAASFAGIYHGVSRRQGERRTRVRRRPTHTDPPIYLLIQCNSMRLSHAYAPLALLLSAPSCSFLFLFRSLACSLS